MSENTQPKRVIGVPFQPGNPGRPKGSRNKLGEDFIAALHEDFQEHGKATIQAVRVEDPSTYLKVISQIVPKELNITHDAFDGVSDEQIAALVAAARSALGVAESGREETRTTAH